MKAIIVLFIFAALSGCAQFHDSNQSIAVTTRTSSGELVTGAECTAENDYGKQKLQSGEHINIHRSSKDLELICNKPNQPQAIAHVKSSINSAYVGDILVGNIIAMVADHGDGKGYTYPEDVNLVFGQTVEIK